jgi:hypothetical protein
MAWALYASSGLQAPQTIEEILNRILYRSKRTLKLAPNEANDDEGERDGDDSNRASAAIAMIRLRRLSEEIELSVLIHLRARLKFLANKIDGGLIDAVAREDQITFRQRP